MDVTVAVCTWNRAAILDQTLDSIRGIAVPAGLSWEVVVVNNNSPDDTEKVLDKYEPLLPLRRFFEKAQGSSHARNRAVAEARGDLLIWIDDDVLVDRNWLAEFHAAASQYPDATFFAGAIEPWFAATPPKDFERFLPKIGPAFAVRDLGPGCRPLANDEDPFSANMAIRTAVQKQYPFDTRLGRVAGGLVGDDESKLVADLRAAGHAGVWVGPSRVKHYMPPDRTTWDYVWRWASGIGQSTVRRIGVRPCATLFGRPRWVLKDHLTHRFRSFLLRQLGRPEWVDHFLRAGQLEGWMVESRRIGLTPADPEWLVKPLAVGAAS